MNFASTTRRFASSCVASASRCSIMPEIHSVTTSVTTTTAMPVKIVSSETCVLPIGMTSWSSVERISGSTPRKYRIARPQIVGADRKLGRGQPRLRREQPVQCVREHADDRERDQDRRRDREEERRPDVAPPRERCAMYGEQQRDQRKRDADEAARQARVRSPGCARLRHAPVDDPGDADAQRASAASSSQPRGSASATCRRLKSIGAIMDWRCRRCN